MPKFIVGARLHDYGKGSPDELFGRVARRRLCRCAAGL